MIKIAQMFFLSMALSSTGALAADAITSDFIDAKGVKIGTASFTPMERGTLIKIDVQLPPGVHGLHAHENGVCEGPDFKSAGGHYNPEKAEHGMAHGTTFHAGDLPNLYVEASGHLTQEILSSRILLAGEGSLQHAALVIHEKPDDYLTSPAGNAGARIACAIIRK